MDINLNHKMMKEICGTVSLKKGDFFYRANKVIVNELEPNTCMATVKGTEDFHVTIKKDQTGNLQTTCSCPTLDSHPFACQHIAAVLLTLYDHQQAKSNLDGEKASSPLTEGLIHLFTQPKRQSIARRQHFDNREVLDVGFVCEPVYVGKGITLIGIELNIGKTKVKDIRDFLVNLKSGQLTMISDDFAYHQNLHCFSKENDAVIQRLIQVVHDEQIYMDNLVNQPGTAIPRQMLVIPPSSWGRLIPLLALVPKVDIKVEGQIYNGFHISRERPPLSFAFSEDNQHGFLLRVSGLAKLSVLNLYKSVLSEGHFIQLEGDEADRLLELKEMLDTSGTDEIPIPGHQLGYFLDKIVPGLKRLGDVQLTDAIIQSRVKIPLVAKLFLDRVKNRLLASLEFQYEAITFNPLEDHDSVTHRLYNRDFEREEEILRLMDESQMAKTDSGFFLHNEELEFEFLYHTVPELEEKHVKVYATTAVKNRIHRGQSYPMIKVRMKKERMNWLEFKFEMNGIADQEIKDILKALEEKRKYYRLQSGALLPLATKEFDKINYFLNALPSPNDVLDTLWSVPFTQGFSMLDRLDGVASPEASFRDFLNDLSHPERLAFDIPESMKPILRDYQKHGFRWMKRLASLGFGGILADDMGLGKTVQSITYMLSELPALIKENQMILIVCPSSLIYNWLSEIHKFAPEIQAVVMDGSKLERSLLQEDLKGVHVVITSYPLLLKDVDWYEKQSFHTVFFDEAQAFKNPVTQTAKMVKKLQAEHRFALTGTPVENSVEELWSIFHVVFPELFRGLKDYVNLSKKTIARRVRPFLLRRRKEDVLSELPEKIEVLESVELLPEQKKLYAAYLAKLRQDTLKHLNKETLHKNKIKILAGLTRLRQICCHPVLFVDGYKGDSAKFEQLKQLIEESMLSGKRVLIFSQFTKMLALIGRELAIQDIPFFYLDGQTPSEERMERCQRFNAGERNFFLISLKAGGTGLNLTGADTVILYDLWWNPAVEEQAADRAHRMGQKNVVEVIKLVARGTIEEKMNELQDKKRHLIKEIIDIGETSTSTSTLTEEDIRDILMI